MPYMNQYFTSVGVELGGAGPVLKGAGDEPGRDRSRWHTRRHLRRCRLAATLQSGATPEPSTAVSVIPSAGWRDTPHKATLADNMYGRSVGRMQPLFSEGDLVELLKLLSV